MNRNSGFLPNFIVNRHISVSANKLMFILSFYSIFTYLGSSFMRIEYGISQHKVQLGMFFIETTSSESFLFEFIQSLSDAKYSIICFSVGKQRLKNKRILFHILQGLCWKMKRLGMIKHFTLLIDIMTVFLMLSSVSNNR